MPYCVELAVWSVNPAPIPLRSITITIIQHPSSSSIIISSSRIFCLLSTCHTIDSGSLGPTPCSADKACPRRNFAEIIETKRAKGCGALCGHRTGIAGGNLNRACPRHNFSEIRQTAPEAAVHFVDMFRLFNRLHTTYSDFTALRKYCPQLVSFP